MAEPGTILLVDDDPGMRLTQQRILEREGYRVIVASNGRAALEIAAGEPFDLALIDYRMTCMDGAEVCAELSRLRPQAALYVVTAHVSSEAAQQAVARGASGILYKPVDVRKLLDLIAEKTGERAGRI